MTEHDGKHPERVLGEYIAADSPGEWLAGEVGEYLFGDEDPDQLEEQLERVFERVDEERRVFVETQLEPSELLQFTIEVERNGRTMRCSFATIPSPVVLLDTCIRIAEVGDQVRIEHAYASGDGVVFAGPWPFGMDWAVRATAPLGVSLVEDRLEEDMGLDGDIDGAINDEDFDINARLRAFFDQDEDLPRWRRVLHSAAPATISAAVSAIVSVGLAVAFRKRR